VLKLSGRLIAAGVDCDLDRYNENPPPSKGWPAWMLDMIEKATFVLVVCTKNYDDRFRRRDAESSGKGAKWEGAVIVQALYESTSGNDKFVPVVFNPSDLDHTPLPLRGTTYYDLSNENGYEELYRRLTGQPRIVKPPLGSATVCAASGSRVSQGRVRPSNSGLGSWNCDLFGNYFSSIPGVS
jgi:hypothetical protein